MATTKEAEGLAIQLAADAVSLAASAQELADCLNEINNPPSPPPPPAPAP